MSTSLKVVRMAAVRCACTSRSAMRLRIALIGTRSSSAADGAGTRRSGSGAVRAASATAGTGSGRAARFGRGLHFLRRAALLDTGNRVADGNPLALAPEDAQHPGALGGQLHGGLVGLELEEDVVRPDPVAVALHPAEDDAFGHGF